LINRVGINPLGLDWKRFIVAETHYGGFIGCGQLKPPKDSSLELASIAVDASYRGQGVARAMIEHLLAPSLLSGRPLTGTFDLLRVLSRGESEELPVGAHQIGVAFLLYLNARFLMEALPDLLICKIFIAEGLQGINRLHLVRIDQVHDAEAAHPEDSIDLILLTDEVTFFVESAGLVICPRGWLWVGGRILSRFRL